MDTRGSAEDGLNVASTEDSPMQPRLVDEITESSNNDSETGTIISLNKIIRHPTMQVDEALMDNLGQVFEHCIHQVSHLEKRRDEMIGELLWLQEPMLRAVGHLRGRLAETQRLLTLAQLDYVAVYEEVQHVKRKHFATARDCIESQVKLVAQEYEVAQSAVTQEELKAHIQSLTQDLSQLKDAHHNKLNSLRAQASKPCRPRAMSDVSLCRQASVRLQRRLSGSVKALEGWYEPRIMALLRRRQVGEDALRRSREQALDLKASLEPLKANIQRLELQRSCLEQRISLMEKEREDTITQHKENVNTLRETLRELQAEFDYQRECKKDLEDLKEGLLTELTFLRGSDGRSETTTAEDP